MLVLPHSFLLLERGAVRLPLAREPTTLPTRVKSLSRHKPPSAPTSKKQQEKQKPKLNTWFTPSLITEKPCMESVNRQYGTNAKRCMESSRKKCTIGDAIRLRQFHTRQSVMPYQALGLNKNNLNCPFWFNLGYFWCGRQDLNLHGKPPDPKSGASANSATPAFIRTLILYNIKAVLSSPKASTNCDFFVSSII